MKEGAGIHDAHPHTHISNFSPNSCRKTSTDLALAPGSPQSAKRSNVKFNIRDFCLLFLISLRFGKAPALATTSTDLPPVHLLLPDSPRRRCAHHLRYSRLFCPERVPLVEREGVLERDYSAGFLRRGKSHQTSFKYSGSQMMRCHDNILKFQRGSERS